MILNIHTETRHSSYRTLISHLSGTYCPYAVSLTTLNIKHKQRISKHTATIVCVQKSETLINFYLSIYLSIYLVIIT